MSIRDDGERNYSYYFLVLLKLVVPSGAEDLEFLL